MRERLKSRYGPLFRLRTNKCPKGESTTEQHLEQFSLTSSYTSSQKQKSQFDQLFKSSFLVLRPFAWTTGVRKTIFNVKGVPFFRSVPTLFFLHSFWSFLLFPHWHCNARHIYEGLCILSHAPPYQAKLASELRFSRRPLDPARSSIREERSFSNERDSMIPPLSFVWAGFFHWPKKNSLVEGTPKRQRDIPHRRDDSSNGIKSVKAPQMTYSMTKQGQMSPKSMHTSS